MNEPLPFLSVINIIALLLLAIFVMGGLFNLYLKATDERAARRADLSRRLYSIECAVDEARRVNAQRIEDLCKAINSWKVDQSRANK